MSKHPLNKSHQCVAISKCDVGHIDSILKAGPASIYGDDEILCTIASNFALKLINNKSLIGSVSRGLADFFVVYGKSSTANSCINFKLNEPFQNHESVRQLSVHYPFCALLSADNSGKKVFIRGNEVLLNQDLSSISLASLVPKLKDSIKTGDLHYNDLRSFLKNRSIQFSHLYFFSTERDFFREVYKIERCLFKPDVEKHSSHSNDLESAQSLKIDSFARNIFIDFGVFRFFDRIDYTNKNDFQKENFIDFIRELPSFESCSDILSNPNKLAWPLLVYSKIIHTYSVHNLVKTDVLVELFLKKGVPLWFIVSSMDESKSNKFFGGAPGFLSQEIEDMFKHECFLDTSSEEMEVLEEMEAIKEIIDNGDEELENKLGYLMRTLLSGADLSVLRAWRDKSSSLINSIKMKSLMNETPVVARRRGL